MSQPFYFSSCPSSSLHYSSSRPPRLFRSLFLPLSLSPCVKVMQLIFLCLFIFQSWFWNVGSRQKPYTPPPHQRAQPPLPRFTPLAPAVSVRPERSPTRAHIPALQFEICIMAVPAQLIPANGVTRTHSLNSCRYFSVKTCVVPTNHSQFILIRSWMC